MTSQTYEIFPQALFIARASEKSGSIEGYASVYDGRPDAAGRIMLSGVFNASIAAHRAAGTMPAMLWDHDPGHPIGRWTSVEEDRRGLKVSGQLNLDSVNGREAYAHLKARDVTGLSIGWYTEAETDFKENPNGTTTYRRARLVEISAVAVPARANALITKVASIDSQRGLERLLHTAGLSRAAAARLAAGGWPALANSQITKSDENQKIASLIDRINAATCELQNKESLK